MCKKILFMFLFVVSFSVNSFAEAEKTYGSKKESFIYTAIAIAVPVLTLGTLSAVTISKLKTMETKINDLQKNEDTKREQTIEQIVNLVEGLHDSNSEQLETEFDKFKKTEFGKPFIKRLSNQIANEVSNDLSSEIPGLCRQVMIDLRHEGGSMPPVRMMSPDINGFSMMAGPLAPGIGRHGPGSDYSGSYHGDDD